MSKILLLTGASRGIGSAILQQLCTDYAQDFIIATATSAEGAKKITSVINESGARGTAMLWDALTPGSAAILIDTIKEKYGDDRRSKIKKWPNY